LGGFNTEDPLRKLPMRESIYSLAFAVNLSSDFFDSMKGE